MPDRCQNNREMHSAAVVDPSADFGGASVSVSVVRIFYLSGLQADYPSLSIASDTFPIDFPMSRYAGREVYFRLQH